jgi:hypothetical protein
MVKPADAIADNTLIVYITGCIHLQFILHGRPFMSSSREEKNWVLAQIIL